MILIITHYAKNKGVTDHFIDFLQNKKIHYYYLKHPFSDNTSKYSDLFMYDGVREIKILSWEKSNNQTIVLLQDFLINIFVSFYLANKISKVFGFGSFNVIANIWTNFLFNRKIFFWGCDYSEVRFSSIILNTLYLWFETIACKYSYRTIHANKRQEDIRMKLHGLNPKKSIIVPNGVDKISIFNWNQYPKVGLLYIGSITEQHGILQIIKTIYIDCKIDLQLYIFGSGSVQDELKKTIKEHKLESKVIYKGYMEPDHIFNYLLNQKINFIGLAPYNFIEGSHVKFGDSLKIKDYLSRGIPYIAPSQLYIPEDLKEFGYIYNHDISEMLINLKLKQLNYIKLQKVMTSYVRSNTYTSLLKQYL